MQFFWLMPIEQMEMQRTENAVVANDIGNPAWWNADWFPFLDDGEGNLICVDAAAKNGQLIQYFHDSADRITVAPSAAHLLGAITEGLETGILVSPGNEAFGWRPAQEKPWSAIRAKYRVAIDVCSVKNE